MKVAAAVDDFLIKCLASTPSPLMPEGDTLWLWFRVIGFLGLLAVGGFLISQYKRKRIVNYPDSVKGKILVADSCSLGNRQFLVVAQYGLEKHLLGVSPGQVMHLAKLDASGKETIPEPNGSDAND